MSKKLLDRLQSVAFAGGYEILATTALLVASIGAGTAYLHAKRLTTLSSRFEKFADANRDGNVSPDEMFSVYQTLGKEHSLTSIPPLSLREMEQYIRLRTESHN
jgi:hypothetical protein